MKRSIFTLMLLSLLGVLSAQPIVVSECNLPTAAAYLHGNDVRAYLNNSGSLFFDGDEARYEVPFGNDIHTIFAQGLWLGGIDPGGNLKLAAQTYGRSSGNGDYFAGPLQENGSTTLTDCSNWDKIWCVARYEIENHISDFEDNGVIDNPIPAIMSWPGKGNPQFEAINGFELPDTPQGLAPYQDVNADGVYNPMDGDYPRIEQSDILPEQICWNVFNDAGNIHSESLGDPLQMEIQLTSWAFNCQDNPQLNQSIFLSYKLINRAIEPIDSLFMALWHDFDLGCYTDDHVGYDESTNSVYVYNQDPVDGENGASCPQGVNTYADNPPVQAATFLNQTLAYGMYYDNGSIGSPSGGNTDPTTPIEIYNLMKGFWPDGSPLQTGGDGYDEGTSPTNIAFPGDPNNPDEWSALSADLPAADRRTVSSVLLPMLPPGAVATVDVGYSFFREENGDYLSNVTAMYEGLEELQSWYQSGFDGACTPFAICETDCVWPGDLNADGIANYCDLIPLGQEFAQSGTTRFGPYNWAPHDGLNWGSAQSNGSEIKHIDANGDGMLSALDFSLTELHYGFTVPGYSGETVVVESSDNGLYLEPVTGSFEEVEAGASLFAKVGIEGYEPLSALAFNMRYDPLYVESITVLNSNLSGNQLYYAANHTELGGMHFATFVLDGEALIESGDLLTVQVKFSEDLADIEVPSDEMIFQFADTKGLDANGEEVIIESQSQVVTFIGLNVSDAQEVLITETAVKVFPNPAKGMLNVQSEQPMLGQLQVFNTAGQLMETLNAEGQQQQSLNLQALPAGLYFLRVRTTKGLVVKRFVIE